MNFSSNPKRALILIMGALVFISSIIAWQYFQRINKYTDPRVIPAREMYERYNSYAQENRFQDVLNLLDSIEDIYQRIPHYQQSYELGVIYNNRTATYLTMAIHFPDSSISLNGIDILSKNTLLQMATANCKRSIEIYSNWIDTFSDMEEDEVTRKIENSYFKGMDKFSSKEKQKFLQSRVNEILTAQYETKRRLSVAYTNMGIIKRHQNKLEEAIRFYQKALELWDRNLAAENNINILLGKPLKKRSIIENIFPPDRKKQ